MSTVAAPQQSDWNTNIYTLTTTRIFIVLGVTYLIRSIVSYFSQTLPSATRVPSIDMETIGHEDVDIVADILNMASSGSNLGTEVSLDLELGLQPPQRSYNPHGRQQRSRADGRGDPQASALSPSATIPVGALGQDAIGRNSRTPNHEDSAEVSLVQNSPP